MTSQALNINGVHALGLPSPDELDNETQICERYLAGLPEVVRAVLPESVIESVLGQRALELRPVKHFSGPDRAGQA